MPCDTVRNLTDYQREQQAQALAELEGALNNGRVSVAIGSGSLAFVGWENRAGLTDLCAYRRLTADNSPALRAAVMAAEAMTGQSIDAQSISAGMHSHDNGQTWSTH